MIAAGVGACGKRDGSTPAGTPEPEWISLTGKWTGVEGGEVVEEDGVLRLSFSDMLTAAKWDGDLPGAPFELELEARRVDGTDFFCAVTFPARDNEFVTWIVGGWGGGLSGISSVDDFDASENETGTNQRFEQGTWYRLKLRREGEKIEAWIDGEKVVDLDTTGRKLSLRPGPISACAPFGLGTWQTTGEIRGAKWRKL